MSFFLLGFVFVLNVFASSASHQGTIEIAIYDDFKGQRSHQEMFVVTKDNRRIYVRDFGHKSLVDKVGKILATNQVVTFSETKQRKSILAKELTVIDETAVAGHLGIRNSLLVIANFQDRLVPCSATQIEDGLFGAQKSVDQLYREISEGETGLTKGASLTVTIDVTSGATCDNYRWTTLADAAVKAAGIDPDNYPQLLYVFPKSTCTYAGLASGRRALSMNCEHPDIFAHEVGHNMGMQHAKTPTNDYGDTTDFMGYGAIGLRGLNGPHKIQQKWIDPSQVVTLSGINNVNIAALNQSAGHAGAPQIYKTPRNDGTFLYLSYRQPLGYDQGAGADSFQGISIHSWAGGATPTVRLGLLKDGQTFYDFKNGVIIYQRNHNSSGVNADVIVAGTTAIGSAVNLRGSVERSKKRKVVLLWDAPRDGATAKDYLVIKDGSVVATVTTPNYKDPAVAINGSYTYSIIARNLEGKFAPESSLISIKVSK